MYHPAGSYPAKFPPAVSFSFQFPFFSAGVLKQHLQLLLTVDFQCAVNLRKGDRCIFMNELQQRAESFEEAAKDRKLSPDHFLRLDQAIARAQKELPRLASPKQDTPDGVGNAVKLHALVERHNFDVETLLAHPKSKGELEALFPGLDEEGLRQFVREFLQELNRQREVRPPWRTELSRRTL